MEYPKLTIRDLTLRAVVIPMRRPLVTRVVTIAQAGFLLIDLHTQEGVTGRTYLFGYSARGCAYLAMVLRDMGEMIKGDPVKPADLAAKVRKGLTLMGHEGITAMAAAGLDMAAWDALATAKGVPLVKLLGGEVQKVRAYNSNGLGLIPPEAAAEEAVELLAEGGFEAVKIRLGRDALEEDLAAIRAVRKAVGDSVILPCDFNQGLGVDEAIRRGRALDKENLYWIEEPIVYDDLKGCARVAREVETPIQIGENFYGPAALAAALDAKACQYVMPDVERIGGVTGWLEAAALAEAAQVPMSSHIFPEVSAHLLAVTPTRHWLEYSDWAAPVLTEPLRVENGHVLISDSPGTGISWDEDAVAKYAIEF